MNKYIPPQFQLKVFSCPHCGAIAEQQWNNCLVPIYNGMSSRYDYFPAEVVQTRCVLCGNMTLWIPINNKKQDDNSDNQGELSALTNKTNKNEEYVMVYPQNLNFYSPSEDMPDSVKELYNEARSIASLSPRGAAALLRLALDKLCDEICPDCKKSKYKGNINSKISLLVANGLSNKLQKAFDFVRITGNDAVHELGIIDIKDNPEITNALFALLNLITEKMITESKQINDLYSLIPKSRRDEIEKRNKKAKGSKNA